MQRCSALPCGFSPFPHTRTARHPPLACRRLSEWSAGGFTDISADSYYAEAVAWAVESGITVGTGNGLFRPDTVCTRAQAVTLLYRASGSPTVSGSTAFSDVAADAYYASAVMWAAENRISSGVGSGLFGSDNDCTRAQLVTLLWRSMR